MDQCNSVDIEKSSKKWFKNVFFKTGIICFILYILLYISVYYLNASTFIVSVYKNFEIVEIIAITIMTFVYSIKEENNFDLKNNLIFSILYVSSFVVLISIIFSCLILILCLIPLFGWYALAIILVGFKTTFLTFVKSNLIRFFYTFTTIFIVSNFVNSIKDFIKSKDVKDLKVISFIKPFIFIFLIPVFFSTYNSLNNKLNGAVTSTIFDIGLSKNPQLVLNNGDALWFNTKKAEFYDFSKKRTFPVIIPFPKTARVNIVSTTILPDNKILIGTEDIYWTGKFIQYKNVYIFNPEHKKFSKVGNALKSLNNTHSIILPTKKVLFVNDLGTTWQVFDQKTGKFYLANSILPMWKPEGIGLNNNKVLIYGGYKEGKNYYARTQLYDISTNKFTLPKNQPISIESISPILLTSGKVLIVSNTENKQTYAIYDPTSNSFSPLSNGNDIGQKFPDLSLLNDGTVLIISNHKIKSDPEDPLVFNPSLYEAEIFDPFTLTFKRIGNTYSRLGYGSSKVKLSDGRILFIGHKKFKTIIEIYEPTTKNFKVIGNTIKGRNSPTLIPTNKNEMIIFGGDISNIENEKKTIEIFKIK